MMTSKAVVETPLAKPESVKNSGKGKPQFKERATSLGAAQDFALVADFLRGERAAVETVSLWVRQAARRYHRRLPGEWDDLLQDLLLEVTVVLREGEFRGECKLSTYVWRIVHYRCLNRIRDRARRPESELGAADLHLPDPSRPILDRLLASESEDLLRRFVETLGDDCRRLWKLILSGHTYRQMSRETGVSEGALRVRVLRCRKKALVRWKKWLETSNG